LRNRTTVSDDEDIEVIRIISARRAEPKERRRVKTSTTVRADADVLAWLRAQGNVYQSRINASYGARLTSLKP